MQREIDTVIQKMQSEIDDMDSKHPAVKDKQEKAINQTITDIEQILLDLRKLLATSDFTVTLITNAGAKNSSACLLSFK